MKCSCGKPCVIDRPPLCKDHYPLWFESRVREAIAQYRLLDKRERVCVATSGGKDSLSLLLVLHRLGYNVQALLIDEGIHGYREHTIADCERFCTAHEIPLTVKSFAKAYGKSLDEALQPGDHPCSICGVRRRELLERGARELGCTVVATGHNADDEAQTVLMNLARAHTELFGRGGPRTEGSTAYLPRVKPLYFLTEKQIMTYAHLHGLVSGFTECPHVPLALRARFRDALYAYAAKHPGVQKRVLKKYLTIKQ